MSQLSRPAADGWDGKVVVVSGSTGGIGSAVVGWLTARGAQVHGLDLRADPHRAGDCLQVDLRDAATIARAVALIKASAGRIDGLVAASGVAEPSTPAEEMDRDVWNRTIETNLTGTFLLSQAIGRVMLEQGSGSIVAVASAAGTHVVPIPQQQIAYNVSKAGLVAMIKSLAYEWAGRGVRVNVVSPGYTDTPLLGTDAEVHDQWKALTPLRRFASPAEIASAAGWLLGDEAAFCCGTELVVDGGYSLV